MNVLVARWHAAGEKTRIHAVRATLDTVRQIALDTRPDVIVFAAEGGHGFRQTRFAGYKATRPEADPGLTDQVKLFHRACEIIGWPVLSSPGLEADDVIATLATDLSERAESALIVTSDKDCLQLLSVPGISIYDPGKKQFVGTPAVQERLGVRPSQVRDYLALCGDTSDNVPGCKGIGAKGAASLLQLGTLEEILQASARCDVIESSADPVSNHWRPALKSLRKIGADRANVELSRDLVTLVTTAPLPRRWELWPATRPRPGWQLKLQELGLGEPARRLAEPRKRGEQPLLGADRDWHEPLIEPAVQSPKVTNGRPAGSANQDPDAIGSLRPDYSRDNAATTDNGRIESSVGAATDDGLTSRGVSSAEHTGPVSAGMVDSVRDCTEPVVAGDVATADQHQSASGAIRLLSRDELAARSRQPQSLRNWTACEQYSMAWWAAADSDGSRLIEGYEGRLVRLDSATDADLAWPSKPKCLIGQARIAGARHMPPPQTGGMTASAVPVAGLQSSELVVSTGDSKTVSRATQRSLFA